MKYRYNFDDAVINRPMMENDKEARIQLSFIIRKTARSSLDPGGAYAVLRGGRGILRRRRRGNKTEEKAHRTSAPIVKEYFLS